MYMNMFNIVKSGRVDNEFVLVFSPNTISINKELNNFVKAYTGEKKITIKMDLIIFVGNRAERFVKFDIDKCGVLKNTITTGVVDSESENITLEIYSKLPQDMINKISPISYRRKVINNKSDMQISLSC